MISSYIIAITQALSTCYSGSNHPVAFDCGPPLLQSVARFIHSPGYPEKMPAPLQCEWRIDGGGKKAGYRQI